MRAFVAVVVLAPFLTYCSRSQVTSEVIPAQPPSRPCGAVEPGKRLTFEAYRTKLETLSVNFQPFVPKAYQELNAMVDREMLPALHEMFSQPNDASTQIIFGSHGTGKDGADGLRVVWFRTITDSRKTRRFLSVITFWTWKDGKPSLIGGLDGLRVRLQLEADSAGFPRGRFGALSYELTLDANGGIKSLFPGYYIDGAGQTIAKGRGQAHPTSCGTCHGMANQTGQLHHAPNNPGKTSVKMMDDLRDFQTDEDALTPANVRSLQHYLDKLALESRTKALIDSFKKPRETFFPVGIVKAIEERCQTLVIKK